MKTNSKALLSSGKVRCPECAGKLVPTDVLTCADCGHAFPLVGDIPLLMPKPEELVGLWQNRFANFVQGQQRNIQSNRQLIKSQALYPPLRERLKSITQAREKNLQAVIELMAPLQALEPGKPPTENVDALGSFVLLTYLLRDWGWDTDEVDILCNTVIESLPSDLSLDSLLVLGSGACRDSYNLHNHFRSKLTVSVDIAPLMLLGADRVVSGGALNLYQILPNNVRNAQDNVSHWQLKAPRKPDNDFLYLFADATRMPFPGGSFQTILTPFIIDAIGEDLRVFAKRLYDLLEPGGYWANFGAMTFLPGISYTAEEVISIISESGFRILKHGFTTKPHLAPRESCQRQVFDCLWFSAIKE